jgi:hypothetical protein
MTDYKHLYQGFFDELKDEGLSDTDASEAAHERFTEAIADQIDTAWQQYKDSKWENG